ncbi:Conserved putative membrane protein [Amycolatopsis japonica]|uniref:Conserved putative membrane protein n=2 Tax=Pseudonocardiaceae TaxID=2070 RepID=A0A075UVB1_9PSEU|nr:Conserved putative membrane protein [Amycolatopsis japonica]
MCRGMHEGQIDLLPGERVIWAGQPVRRPLFNPGDYFNVPVGLLWLGAVTVFFAANHDTAFHTAAWVVLTVAGVLHLAGRPLIRYLRLASTTYAVTDGRVIATSSLVRRKEESAALAGLADPVVTPGPGKTGTITFGRLGVLAWASANFGAGTGKDRKPPVILVGVSDVAKVREKLAKAVEEARNRNP